MFSFASKNLQRHTAETEKVGFTRFGEVPVIGLLVGIAGGILSLIVMFALVPVIGESVDQAMPEYSDNSEWDPSGEGNNIPTGVELWQTIGPLLVLCALVAVVMIVLKLIGVF